MNAEAIERKRENGLINNNKKQTACEGSKQQTKYAISANAMHVVTPDTPRMPKGVHRAALRSIPPLERPGRGAAGQDACGRRTQCDISISATHRARDRPREMKMSLARAPQLLRGCHRDGAVHRGHRPPSAIRATRMPQEKRAYRLRTYGSNAHSETKAREAEGQSHIHEQQYQ